MFNPPSHNRLPSVKDIKTDRVLPPISPWVIGGGWFIVGTLSITAGMTTVVTYKTVVRVPMTVRPEGELRLVQSPLEGSVVSIDVKDNQLVQKGQTIATLDGSKLRTRQKQIKESIIETQNQIAQIDAQIALLDGQAVTEENRIATTVAMAKAELADSKRNYHDRQVTTSAEVREAQANLQLAKEEFSSYQVLVKQGVVAQLGLTQKQAAAEVASARLDQLKTALNPNNSDVTIAQEKITNAYSQGNIAISQLKQTQFQIIQQRSELRETLNSSTQELQQVIKDLASTEIKAVTAGTIQSLNLRNISQVVQSGETIATIFPDGVESKVQALVPPEEISKIEVGQAVKIRISACPFSQFGTLPGVVRTISPDALSTSSDDNKKQDSTFYAVMIQPQRSELEAGEQKCFIQSGMDGRADIITRKETVLDFVLQKTSLAMKL
jgi:HlyD family type I secretion membrane fusion protein